jgi:MFS transporter, SET family, sugar efflux transporter
MSFPMFGVMMTAVTLVSVFTSSFISARSDATLPRRDVLILGCSSGALGYVGYAFIRNEWGLLLVGISVLSVASVTFSQIFAYARDLIDEEEVAEARVPLFMNAIRMFVALSWTVGPALASVLLEMLSFRGLFLCVSALYAAIATLLWFSVRATPPRRVASSVAIKVGMLGLPNGTAVRLWFLAFVLIFAAQTICMSNLPLLILNELHGTSKQVGIAYSVAPVFELPLMLYMGLLAIRIDLAKLIFVATLIAGAYYVALALVEAPWHVYPLQLLSAATVAVLNGVAITFFQNKMPGQAGAATNHYVNAMRIGSTSGYLLFGVIAEQFGHRGAFVACTLLVAAALGIIGSTSVSQQQRPGAVGR